MKNIETFKDEEYVALVYMTGILPIKKYGTQSALNMFEEFSMIDAGDLETAMGFTEREVKELCELYHMDFAETRRWYDGYFVGGKKHIYNPKSVVDCMRRRKFGSYWTRTEAYESLSEYIDMDFDGLRESIMEMLAGAVCPLNPSTFKNDLVSFENKEHVMTLLVHYGYLAYDGENGMKYKELLKHPNNY